jgi:hypothetical protein
MILLIYLANVYYLRLIELALIRSCFFSQTYLISAAAKFAFGFFKNSFLHSTEQNPKTFFS